MASLNDDFRTWMSGRGMTLEKAAALFGVEKQTVANWRSAGIPERRGHHVRAIIDKHPVGEPDKPLLDQPLLISATRDQFRRWNAAALGEGQLIEDWAIQGLDELAEAWETAQKEDQEAHLNFQGLKVAEDGTTGESATAERKKVTYRKQKRSS